MASLTLSVIVPAFNEETCLPTTLAALSEGARGLDCELIVVDNASTDGTASIAREHGVTVVTEPIHNIARVRNAGARHARGTVLVFIDADTLAPPALLGMIEQAMAPSYRAGGAVAVSYAPFERTWMRWYVRGWAFWGRLFNMKQGAAQFCRRDIFEALGGYDETIYMGEDIHFYWRLSRWARRNGRSVTFIDEPPVVTSSRRFDRMNVLKTIVLTHPLLILWSWRRRSTWRDWYERPLR